MSNQNSHVPPTLIADAAYLLEGEYTCHECSCIVPVFALMLLGPFKAEGDVYIDEDDNTALLRRPTALPEILEKSLTSRSCGFFRDDFSHTAEQKYWMNHCRECGTKIGDWYVSEPDEAFFPTTDTDMLRLKGQRFAGPFKFDDPSLSLSSWTSLWLAKVKSQL